MAAGLTHTLVLTRAGEVYRLGEHPGSPLCHHGGGMMVSHQQKKQYLGTWLFPPESVPATTLHPSSVPPLGRAAWPAGEAAVGVAAGDMHSLVLSSAGRVLTCGEDDYGQLGWPQDVEYSTSAQWAALPASQHGACAVSAGALHSAVLLENGDVLCCGDNDHSQLGRGDPWTEDPWGEKGVVHGEWAHMEGVGPSGGGPRGLQLSAGDKYTVVLAADGVAYGCGSDTRGELGPRVAGPGGHAARVRALCGFAGFVQPVREAARGSASL